MTDTDIQLLPKKERFQKIQDEIEGGSQEKLSALCMKYGVETTKFYTWRSMQRAKIRDAKRKEAGIQQVDLTEVIPPPDHRSEYITAIVLKGPRSEVLASLKEIA